MRQYFSRLKPSGSHMLTFALIVCVLQRVFPLEFDSSSAYAPFPSLDAAPVLPSNKTFAGFLSKTLGDHMVLQCAPQQAVVWGTTVAGATVFTAFNGRTLTTVADALGIWRQHLPPMTASAQAYTLTFVSSAGDAATLSDVLFGEVYICGGQSNMAFPLSAVTNASAEVLLADHYPQIRVFTVGQGTRASPQPLSDLWTIVQPWSVASKKAMGVDWKYFSAVCWFFGRRLADALSPEGAVPIGLISSNWGGTSVVLWSTPEAFTQCGIKPPSSSASLYNAMIHPYTVGPMAIAGFSWYQGLSVLLVYTSLSPLFGC